LGPFLAQNGPKMDIFRFFSPESAQKLFFSPKINEIRLPDASQPLGMSLNHLKHAKIQLFHDFQFRAVLALFYPLGCSVQNRLKLLYDWPNEKTNNFLYFKFL